MFQGCYKLSGGRGVKEGEDGAGVDADFILYVAAKNTRHCRRGSVAYATYCQLEKALDRYEHTAMSYTNIHKQTNKQTNEKTHKHTM